MKDKIAVDRPVIVEGKYDRIRLESVIRGTIVTTEGFGLFRDGEKRRFLRRLAAEKGVIVLTDSDGGGLVIRNYISSVLPKDKVIHLYIPECRGREKRKRTPSREGLLGVEGMSTELLTELFRPYASTAEQPARRLLTKAELYADGLSGGAGSAERRKALCRAAGLPSNIGANALLEAINLLYGYDGYRRLLRQTEDKRKENAGGESAEREHEG